MVVEIQAQCARIKNTIKNQITLFLEESILCFIEHMTFMREGGIYLTLPREEISIGFRLAVVETGFDHVLIRRRTSLYDAI